MDWLSLALSPSATPAADAARFWAVIGWVGNACFFSRFMVQWYATERRGQVVVPAAFWWLSLAGSLLLLAYALFHGRDPVIIAGYAFNWIPYLRNLVIHRRQEQGLPVCTSCGHRATAPSPFCPACGSRRTAGA
ncbi:MAG TPA: lipid A biosynthesis protein [Verrucomicrobiales bacterium]|nr:lipid A biosynthesis protein [Verrucomicrobiales bacterium]